MSIPRALPVLMPRVAGQQWSCHSCGNCCRTLVGHLLDEDRKRIDEQGWAAEMDVAPYVRLKRGWALNKRPDGACVFLTEDNRCKIHGRYGEEAKPLACRIFPFSVRPVATGWQGSVRFDCPSVASSKGKPIGEYRTWLEGLTRRLEHRASAADDMADLTRGLRASPEEIEVLLARFTRWLSRDDLPLDDRLRGASRITAMLADARYKTVRGARFGELLDLLFQALPAESTEAAGPATRRQKALFRQLVFAHAEHVTLDGFRAGAFAQWVKRLRQMGTARRFLRGAGTVPPLSGLAGTSTFEAVEGVAVTAATSQAVADLVCRYLYARLSGRSVFGEGYYGWPVFVGLAALWLSVGVAGWLARFAAAADGRTELTYEDAAQALGIVDRAATRAPALGTSAERLRTSYLLRDDGVARLLAEYTLV